MTAGTHGDLDIDLLSPEAVADPYTVYQRLRETDPVHWSQRHRSWFLTRFDDVAAAFRDERFSADRISGFRRAKLSGPDADPDLVRTFDVLAKWMVFQDDPDHARLRRLVSKAFTPRAIEKLRGTVLDQCNDLIDGFVDVGRADLIESFAYPLTAGVVGDMLGVPREDRDRFKVWSDQLATLISGGQDNPDRYTEATRGTLEFVDYLSELLEVFTRDPADNLMSALVMARDEGEKLSHDEVVATCVLLLFAGHETTTNLMGNFVLALLKNPDRRAEIAEGRADMGKAVEEIMRYDGPARADIRVLTDDVTIRGKTLRKGFRVILCMGSANRDPEAFDRPDEIDFDRPRNNQLGFGIGAHYCLGAPLARMEASLAIPLLLERLPEMRLANDAAPTWLVGLLNRGLTKLDVVWDTTKGE